MPLAKLHAQNPWGRTFVGSALNKRAGVCALVGLGGISALALTKADPFGLGLGPALYGVFDSVFFGKPSFVLQLSFLTEIIRGVTTPRDEIAVRGPVLWFDIQGKTRHGGKTSLVAGAAVCALGFWILPDALNPIYTETSVFNRGLNELPLDLGGYLWTLGSLGVIAGGAGLLMKQAIPDLWGMNFQFSRRHPLAYGTTYLFLWEWILSSYAWQTPEFGKSLAQAVHDRPLAATAFTLFTVLGVPVIQGLFSDRDKDEEPLLGKSAWGWGSWFGDKFELFARIPATFLGIGILDKLVGTGDGSFGLAKALGYACDWMPWGLGDAFLGLLGTVLLWTWFRPKE
jgi:hypothetical protein